MSLCRWVAKKQQLKSERLLHADQPMDRNTLLPTSVIVVKMLGHIVKTAWLFSFMPALLRTLSLSLLVNFLASLAANFTAHNQGVCYKDLLGTHTKILCTLAFLQQLCCSILTNTRSFNLLFLISQKNAPSVFTDLFLNFAILSVHFVCNEASKRAQQTLIDWQAA